MRDHVQKTLEGFCATLILLQFNYHLREVSFDATTTWYMVAKMGWKRQGLHVKNGVDLLERQKSSPWPFSFRPPRRL